MKVNFFDIKCQTITKENIFGICENEANKPAFLDFKNTKNWIVTIENFNSKEIKFTAIDHCVDIKRENNELENRCDVMLQFEKNIIFIELKNKKKDWINKGFEQLEKTIKIFIENNRNYFYELKSRKAYVSNKKTSKFSRN